MKPWLRLDQDAHYDAKVRKARAGAVWPWVLTRLKRGDGVASAEDIDAFAAADGCSIPEELAAAQIAGLRTVGLLVETDGGWTTPRWSEHQADPTAAERQRKSRARNSRASADADARAAQRATVTDVTVTGVTDRDVTDVTVTHSESRSVTARHGSHARQDRTGQDRNCIEGEADESSRSRGPDTAREGYDDDDEDPIQAEQERRDRAAVRAAHERRVEMARGSAQTERGSMHPDVAEAFRAWHRTHAGAAPLSSAVVDMMRRTIEHYGPDLVTKGLDAWLKTANGGGFAPVAFVEKVCERIADEHEQAEQRAEQRAQWEAEAEERRRVQEQRAEEESKFTPEQREANIKLVNGLFAEMNKLLSGRSPFASSTH